MATGADECVVLFESIGLSNQKAIETAKNSLLSKNLTEVIEYAKTLSGGNIQKFKSRE